MLTAPGAETHELADIIRAAACLLPRTARAIERCRTDWNPGVELARECGDLVRRHMELGDQVARLAPTPLGERVGRLLYCQMYTVNEASHLSARIHDERWPELARRFGDGSGVADALLHLAAEMNVRHL